MAHSGYRSLDTGRPVMVSPEGRQQAATPRRTTSGPSLHQLFGKAAAGKATSIRVDPTTRTSQDAASTVRRGIVGARRVRLCAVGFISESAVGSEPNPRGHAYLNLLYRIILRYFTIRRAEVLYRPPNGVTGYLGVGPGSSAGAPTEAAAEGAGSSESTVTERALREQEEEVGRLSCRSKLFSPRIKAGADCGGV